MFVMHEPEFEISQADDWAVVARLFRAYAEASPIDLGYQDFEAELASLPGMYAPPDGALLLARADGEVMGCVALRPLNLVGCCEMKRLYVSPAGRGRGLGRALIDAIIAEAVRIGYREMRLDTLASMDDAISLYTQSGFEQIPAYYVTPVADTVFFRLTLAGSGPVR